MKEIVFNTGETNQELKDYYNPDGSLLRQIQLRLLDMLIYFDKICKEISVDYRIDGGTVLGAVRHGGFIPWDDDVDVVVEDIASYKKLCKYLRDNPHKQYVIQNDDTDKGCIKYWSTLRDINSEYIHLDHYENAIDSVMQHRGLQIDIFPYEAGVFPSLYFRYARLGRKERLAILKKDYKKAQLIHRIRKYIINPILHYTSKFFGNQNYYMHSYGEGFDCRFPKDILLPHNHILFEGFIFPCPAKPIEFCKILYGDYMNLPPKEERNQHLVTYKIW